MTASQKNGDKYYEYLLVYTDDVLVISCSPSKILECLEESYILKKSSIKEPDQYLGADVKKFFLPDQPEKVRWSMGSEQYLKEALKNLNIWADEKGYKLAYDKSGVLPLKYHPELDTSPLLPPDEANFYMCLVGIT